jgi:site-specific recombinase XerD
MTSLRLLPAATLGDQFQEYLVHAQTYRGLADHTICAYARDGRKFLRWATAAGLPEDPAQITRAPAKGPDHRAG